MPIKCISVHLRYELQPFAQNEEARSLIVSSAITQLVNTEKKTPVESALNIILNTDYSERDFPFIHPRGVNISNAHKISPRKEIPV